ncbi:MAG: ABC transporter permease [Thermomicrobiales bacterium]
MATLSPTAVERSVLATQRRPSARRRVWQRFASNRLSLFGLAMLTLLTGMSLIGPLVLDRLAGLQPNTLSCETLAPASTDHPLGCDQLGRDLLARLVVGGRVSISVGLLVALCTTVIGLIVGLSAGYFGATTDSVLMRFTDTMLGMPTFFIVLAAAALLGPNLFNTILIIGLTQWMTTARLIRGECLAIREKEFILAARASGLTHLRVMRHILPNVMPTLIVVATLAVASGILIESGLSYLGLGVQPPNASWGSMLSNAQGYIFVAPSQGVYPGVLIVLTVLAVNFVGEGLRDALDPRLGGR